MLFSRKCLPGLDRAAEGQAGGLQRGRRVARRGQPGQFRLDSARHGLPEHATEINRPEPGLIQGEISRKSAQPAALEKD